MKPFYFEAKTETEVDIHIFGAIGWNNSNYGDGTDNTAYSIVSLIKRLDKTYQRINVFINSPGGNISEGLAIYNTLKSANAEIHTYNVGLTASMASILMMAGTSHMYKSSIKHLHSASTGAWGNISDLEQAIEALKVFQSVLVQAVADKTGKTIEEVNQLWFDNKEHYMTAEQALEHGLVDHIEETKATPPAAINQLETMTMNQLMDLYKDGPPKDKLTIKERINHLLFNNNNSQKPKADMSKPLIFKAKLTILLALLSLEHFTANENNKIELEIDEAFKINDLLTDKDAEIENLKQVKLNLENQVAALNTRNSDLQAKIDGTEGEGAINPKTVDNSQAGTEGTATMSKADVEKLYAYNSKK